MWSWCVCVASRVKYCVSNYLRVVFVYVYVRFAAVAHALIGTWMFVPSILPSPVACIACCTVYMVCEQLRACAAIRSARRVCAFCARARCNNQELLSRVRVCVSVRRCRADARAVPSALLDPVVESWSTRLCSDMVVARVKSCCCVVSFSPLRVWYICVSANCFLYYQKVAAGRPGSRE